MCSVMRCIFLLIIKIFLMSALYNIVSILFLLKAIKELNIKTKNWKELLTDEPFAKEDIITIQASSTFNLCSVYL